MDELGSKCIIYMHDHIEQPTDNLILLKSELNEMWEDTWRELVTGRVSATPCLVFAGLGSPTAILTKSVGHVRNIAPSAPNVYLVKPSNTSPFTTALELPESNIVQMAWCAFMDRLA